MSHTRNVPSINVVTSEAPVDSDPPPRYEPVTQSTTAQSPVSPTTTTSAQAHSRSPSDPGLLSAPSPILARPASPASSTEDAPPSPTSAVHFKTTTDLRGHSPGDGMSSLQAVQQHARKNSAASFQTVTEPDHSSPAVPPSFATSVTAGAPALASPTKKRSSDDKEDGNDTPAATVPHINPVDDHTDPTPFAFKPLELAALVDPKTLQDLDKMGGLQGLCTGLGTSPTTGLSAHSLGQGAGADGEKSGGEGPFAAPLSDRQRVYGTNSLPTRASKTLLQLMWLALKDKVLVC
jgi:P-type Ca2+ transporter type 2C